LNEKRPFWGKVFKFVSEKGFYIVLFLCVAVISVSAWMISDSIGGLEEADTDALSVKATATIPAVTATPKVEATPPATAKPTAPASPAPTPAAQVEKPESEPISEPIPDPETTTVMAAEVKDDEGAFPASFIWPVSGTVETPHSVETLVYSRTMADWRTHSGIDVAAALGAKVMAVADGTVERIYEDERYGTTVVIHHGGGLRSIYANLAQTPAVTVGSTVALGDTIGSVGATAMSEIGDVTHLHFEMTLDGELVDPQDHLPLR